MSTGLITLACLFAVGPFLPIALPSPAQIMDTPWRSPLARVGIIQQPTILIFSRPASLSLLAVWLLGKARPSLFVTHFLYMDIRMGEAGAKAAKWLRLIGALSPCTAMLPETQAQGGKQALWPCSWEDGKDSRCSGSALKYTSPSVTHTSLETHRCPL